MLRFLAMRLILVIAHFLWPIPALDVYILAFNRTESTLQCLGSLSEAYYPPGSRIKVTVQVDRLPDGTVNEKLIRAIRGYEWPHGPRIQVKLHRKHVGLREQWLSVRARDYTLILEDDLVVSRYYYAVLQAAIARDSRELLGASLQRPQWQQGQNERGRWRRLDLIPDHHPAVFTFMAPATWGLLVYPRQWNAFVHWAQRFLANSQRRYTGGAITTKWMRERGEDRLITPVMFEYLKEHDSGIVHFWAGNRTALAASRPLEPNNVHMMKYYPDVLLDASPKVVDIVEMLWSTRPLPRFSACLDPIVGPLPPPHSKRLMRLAHFLRDVCRVPNGLHLAKPSLAAMQQQLARHCPPQDVGHLFRHGSVIKCPYQKGLYPDISTRAS